MLSRVAESIYWMSRYVERAENVARFLDVNQRITLDLPGSEAQQWEPLIATSGDDEAFRLRYGAPTQENVIFFLTFDLLNANSIYSCVTKARENARTIREVISSEMWEQLNALYFTVRGGAPDKPGGDVGHAFFDRVKMASHLFCGITDNTFSRGEGWHFAEVGRMLERADKTARILDVRSFMLLPDADDAGAPYDTLLWSALLRSASAFEMYRKRHGQVQPERVAEFLILDREIPRSIRFCVARAEESLRAIRSPNLGSRTSAAAQGVGGLRTGLDFAHISEIMRHGLHEYLDNLQLQLNRVGDAMYDTFFAVQGTLADRPAPMQQQQ